MASWGQPQQGFQYPMQTGFQPNNNPQFQQQQPQFNPNVQPQFAGLQPQRTGFPMQPQQTGFPMQQQPMQAQPTGFGFHQQQQHRAPPPVPPLPTQFQGQQSQLAPMPNRFLSASPGPNPLMSQPTGFAGRMAQPLVAQPTGFMDPRLQMMSQTFMPMNAAGMPQLAPQQNLQQSFQQYNQGQSQQVSWALSKQEKKNYDKIFRSWDTSGSGFIEGANALQVFGQCGLPQQDLAKIWSLADIDDRGKLNVAEFHVAMGLIYRRLNGTPLPDVLPAELVPPSARDLDSSVDFLKDVLKHESRASPSAHDGPISRAKQRSFNSSPGGNSSRDATIYKHSDLDSPAGGFYKPRSRHVDRDAIRRTDDDSPTSDLTDMKRQLANTAHMLDRNHASTLAQSKEDAELDQEMADLKYRVKRVREDLDYNQRGPRTAAKEEEKRKLERELLELMHERIPEVERKVAAREERKEREKRAWARDRDRANDRFGRFDAGEDSYSSRRYDDRPSSRNNYDRPASRNNYDRPSSRNNYDRPASRNNYGGHRERSRSREREPERSRASDYDRDRPVSRGAPSPGPTQSSLRAEPQRAAARSPAPNLRNMTPEQRSAHAQRLIQERRIALGLDVAPSATTPVDTGIEDRLALEKKEAEEKARAAEKDREERERVRKERLDRERGVKEEAEPPAPTPTIKVAPAPEPTQAPAPKPAPPTPTRGARGAPPPPPTRSRGAPPAPPAPQVPKTHAFSAPVAAPVEEADEDDEEAALRLRLKQQKDARLERLRKQIEEEEAEAARAEEEALNKRMESLRMRKEAANVSAPVPAPAPPVAPPVAPAFSAPPAPAPPPAPPAPPAAPPTVEKSSTNPFSRMMAAGGAIATPASPPAAAAPVSHNPWASRAQQPTLSRSPAPAFVPPVRSAAPPRSPSIPAPKSSYNTASHDDDDDDWGKEKEDSDDSSDEDEFTKSRAARANIAATLFGGGGSTTPIPRAPSAPPAAPAPPAAAPAPSPPAPPAAPPAPPMSAPPAAPPAPPPAPPMAPPAPAFAMPPPSASEAPAAPAAGGMGALLASIQGGMKLRATKTVDKSKPSVTGKVIGGDDAAAPPPHINLTPVERDEPEREPQPEAMMKSKVDNRQSVDWMHSRAAADAGIGALNAPAAAAMHMPAMQEEEEGEDSFEKTFGTAGVPAIQVEGAAVGAGESELMADVDKSIQHRVRSLYAYEGDGPEDLSFGENVVLLANPSKTGGDWWFGTTVKGGKSGLFPKTYVEVVHPQKAKAMYDYAPENPDELALREGEVVSVVDRSDAEWWKAERDGVVLVVPAAYLELVQDASGNEAPSIMAVASPGQSDSARATASIRVAESVVVQQASARGICQTAAGSAPPTAAGTVDVTVDRMDSGRCSTLDQGLEQNSLISTSTLREDLSVPLCSSAQRDSSSTQDSATGTPVTTGTTTTAAATTTSTTSTSTTTGADTAALDDAAMPMARTPTVSLATRASMAVDAAGHAGLLLSLSSFGSNSNNEEDDSDWDSDSDDSSGSIDSCESSSDEGDGYMSFVESDEEQEQGKQEEEGGGGRREREREREDGRRHEEEKMARERERQMVLEAAGLIVKTVEGVKPPSVPTTRLSRHGSAPTRAGTVANSYYQTSKLKAASAGAEAGTSIANFGTTTSRKRRPPPEAPIRSRRPKPKRMYSKDKDLPPIPILDDDVEQVGLTMKASADSGEGEGQCVKSPDPIVQLDDAYARYESFRNQQAENMSRSRRNPRPLSAISTDSAPPLSSYNNGGSSMDSPVSASFTIVDYPTPVGAPSPIATSVSARSASSLSSGPRQNNNARPLSASFAISPTLPRGGAGDNEYSAPSSTHRSHFRDFFSRARTPEPVDGGGGGGGGSGGGTSSIRKLTISGPMALGSVSPQLRSGTVSPRRSWHGALSGVVSPAAELAVGGYGGGGSPRGGSSSNGSKGGNRTSARSSSGTLAVPAPMSASSTVAATPLPQVQVESSPPPREASPSFGTSWTSLVDRNALEGIPTNERKRQEAIFELINTEVAYVRDLQLIVEVFYSSMLDIMSHKEITVVFANIEDILLTNTALLSALEERQKDCRLYIDKIGDILLAHLPNMGVYMEYCVNQQTANKVLQTLKQSNPQLVEHMNKLKDNPATRNLDLPSYLLEPMQRITRYPLLIKQIARYTSASDAPDLVEQNSIAQAQALSERLLAEINETIRDQEGKEVLKMLSERLWIGQGRLDLTAPTRFMGQRKLLKQGVLAKAKSGRKLKVFLCSDILVLTDQSSRNLYRLPIPLAHTELKELVGTLSMKDDTGFQVIQAYARGGEVVALRASSPKECQAWMDQIEVASRKCRHAEERAVRRGYSGPHC